MRAILVGSLMMALLSCGDGEPDLNPATLAPSSTQTAVEKMALATSVAPARDEFYGSNLAPSSTQTAVEKMAAATSVALARDEFYGSERCEEARDRLARPDFVEVNVPERGWPTWEERFLSVDLVARAKLLSSNPQMVVIDDGESDVRYYQAIEMTLRVLEVFRGSVPYDHIVVWQIGWHYYGSYEDARCVRLEDIADHRKDLAHFDDKEAVVFLKSFDNMEVQRDGLQPREAGRTSLSLKIPRVVDWSGKLSRFRGNYFLARLPDGGEPPNSLKDERWRWLPHYAGDSYHDRKYSVQEQEEPHRRDSHDAGAAGGWPGD